MSATLEVRFTPADFAALAQRDLSQTICVVFDIFRATSTIVTALAHHAAEVIPVAEIPDALAIRQRRPEVLLAGERDGRRISAQLSGGTEFDLGNSPREFTSARIQGKTIVISTTNGSRALRACAGAQSVLIGSFLNLRATADWLAGMASTKVLLVCSGTGEQAAYEDILGAGALTELIWKNFDREAIADSANVALQIYQQNSKNLTAAVEHCRNGRRLLAMPELRDDVAYCLQRDIYSLVAAMSGDTIKILR
jgi:2-phosphosulfolactate phosphatase